MRAFIILYEETLRSGKQYQLPERKARTSGKEYRNCDEGTDKEIYNFYMLLLVYSETAKADIIPRSGI
jgi:hypothetical protein